MAKRHILDERDPSLRKLSRNVTVFDNRLHELLDDMAETLTDAEGAGLAAVQVGVLRRIFITDIGDGITEYINPEIVELSDDMLNESEGCLSFPGQYGMVERPRYVKMEGQDRYGNPVTFEGDGLLARAMCHEYDHLNGVLFYDLATEMLDEEEAQREANQRQSQRQARRQSNRRAKR